MTAGVHGGLRLVTDTDRTTLRNLAAAIVDEKPRAEQAAAEQVPLIAAECRNAHAVFGQLIEGVRDLAEFDDNAEDYAAAMEFPTKADALDRLRDGLAGNVEGLLDQLTTGLDEPERFDMSGSTRGAER